MGFYGLLVTNNYRLLLSWITYIGSVWIELIVTETENWKYFSKIIFKCANSIVWPIFNIFYCMNSAVNSDKQCMNSDFCPLHSEPMGGYCSRAGRRKKKKKKKTEKRKTWMQDSVESKHTHNTHHHTLPYEFFFFFYYSLFRYTQSYYMSLPHIFLQFIFVLRKGNRGLFLNLREWKCVHHESWHYSLILGSWLAKRTSRIEFYSGWHESTFKDNAFAVWFYSIVRLF